MGGTGTGIYGVFLLVWVPSMDLYERRYSLTFRTSPASRATVSFQSSV